jgi:hypothetical protein
MSENPPPAPAPQPIFTVGSTVVAPSSAEIAFPLREDQFQTFCEGETSTDRATRDLCIGLFVGAVVGLATLLATTDWTTVWTRERRTPFLWSLGILIFITAGSLIGTAVCWIRVWKTKKDSSYSRLKGRIENFFASQRGSE